VRSRDLELVHAPDTLGAFVVRVAGKEFAIGQNHPLIGYVTDGTLRWFDLSSAAERKLEVRVEQGTLRVNFEGKDADGGRWVIQEQFSPRAASGAIDIRVDINVDQQRAVAFLPMLMLFPGTGSFGSAKEQALFAGLEYLENEASSSEADVVGPASQRQVPDTLKVTFPLMAIAADNRFLGLVWQMRPYFGAVFDSPDRLFGSTGHAMGILFPGSNGKNRVEGAVLPKEAEVLNAHSSLVLNATLIGGAGNSVVPAIQQYVNLRGLPPLPLQGINFQQYVEQAAAGWLVSKIREGSLVRHAIAQGGFKAGGAADAGLWMDWLACQTQRPELADRLRETAQEVLKAVPAEDLNSAAVGHVRYPVPALVYGNVAANALRAEARGRDILGRFQPDGRVLYQVQPGGLDFAKTHFSKEANGLASASVLDLLEQAAFSGTPELLAAGLKELRALDKFHDGVPRGAQTWECPLHTPDILASAHLVKAYTLGFELTGDRAFLEQARYWAWTGVPFVYLVNPTGHPVGLFSTIAVFGATQWRAPVWLGLPVQWCGLVYADALYGLARHDPTGPWKKLAAGITISGIQQSWSSENPDSQGLLPDSFDLRGQHRNGPAINPATVEACAAQYFAAKPVYDFCCFATNGVHVHAPGGINNKKETMGKVEFQIDGWPDRPYYVLINGLRGKPQLKLDGKSIDCSSPHQFLAPEGRLILQVSGSPHIELGL